MADPVISNLPPSIPADQSSFFQDLKSSVEFLLGHGRNLEANRALRVGELANMGIDINAFLRGTPQSPHLPFESVPSGDMPDPPTGLSIQKGLFSHTLTWTNPTDTNVSHIEVWVAVDSQNIIDASLIAIVTVTPDLRGEEGKYINAGFDVTADMTYWIRSMSYGDVYSEWHPTLVMGGVAVAGDESVSETIDGVINLLKGGTPELYAAGTVYSLYDRCRTADGRVWESTSVADHSGNQPPNATYWKRAGILMTGDVDGTPTAAIDGNLVVDDTILARHIQAGSIVAEHMAANQVLVGHTIESANFETGVSGWQIDGVGGTAEFNNIALTISYSSISGTKPPVDADKTSSNTAYDTARVDGASASTVRIDAANGATFTSSSYVANAQMGNVTSIMGGKVTTSRIQSATTGSYYDLSTGSMYYANYGTIFLGSSALVWGNTVQLFLGFGEIYTSVTSSGINLKTNSTDTIRFNTGNLYPITSNAASLGGTSNCWNQIHCTTFWAGGTQRYDDLDDLQVLYDIKTHPSGKVDMMSLPKQFTSYDKAFQQIKKQNGKMLSDKEIHDSLADEEDMGDCVQLDLGRFTNLIEGAVRQLDQENSATQFEILDWLSDLDKRIKKIERKAA